LQANNTSHSYYFFNMKKKMKRLSSSKPQLWNPLSHFTP
jgi:hypothetical protein